MRIVMRRIRGRWQLAFLVALSLAALTVGQARAAFPGANGKIVFRTNRDGNAEIYTMNADGSGRVDLTRNPAEDVDPRWSPDGSRIVFASNRSGNYEIYTMNAGGGGLTRLTYTSTDNRRPAWTADGHILFHSNTFPNRIVYRINADGSGLQQLTPASSDNAYPTASPRGTRIAFSSLRSGTQRLYTMNTDGGAVQLVTPAPPGPETADVEANWSPRGNDLVFVRFDALPRPRERVRVRAASGRVAPPPADRCNVDCVPLRRRRLGADADHDGHDDRRPAGQPERVLERTTVQPPRREARLRQLPHQRRHALLPVVVG
jgi:dipeptidyl aminopeptidase/acylaminoacyl peptidase